MDIREDGGLILDGVDRTAIDRVSDNAFPTGDHYHMSSEGVTSISPDKAQALVNLCKEVTTLAIKDDKLSHANRQKIIRAQGLLWSIATAGLRAGPREGTALKALGVIAENLNISAVSSDPNPEEPETEDS